MTLGEQRTAVSLLAPARMQGSLRSELTDDSSISQWTLRVRLLLGGRRYTTKKGA